MKKFFVSVLVCAVVLFGAGTGFAGKGYGAGDGTGPIHDVLSGTPFVFTGDVIGFASDGGLILSTGSENVQIYGIGPVYYWESQLMAYPVIGDALTASGFTVNYNGVDKNVVMSITIEDATIELRDPESGKPLWRGSKGVSAGSGVASSNHSGNSGSSNGNGGSGGSGGSASSGGSSRGTCK